VVVVAGVPLGVLAMLALSVLGVLILAVLALWMLLRVLLGILALLGEVLLVFVGVFLRGVASLLLVLAGVASLLSSLLGLVGRTDYVLVIRVVGIGVHKKVWDDSSRIDD
jgi:hypothetical protein